MTIVEPGLVATEINDYVKDEATRAMLDSYTNSIKTLDAADIAAAVLYAVTQPPHVSVNELLVRPSAQSI